MSAVHRPQKVEIATFMRLQNMTEKHLAVTAGVVRREGRLLDHRARRGQIAPRNRRRLPASRQRRTQENRGRWIRCKNYSRPSGFMARKGFVPQAGHMVLCRATEPRTPAARQRKNGQRQWSQGPAGFLSRIIKERRESRFKKNYQSGLRLGFTLRDEFAETSKVRSHSR